MSEKLPTTSIESDREGHKGSPETFLSDEIFAFARKADTFEGKELRKKIIEIAERVLELEKKSRTDELTGLLNRGGFHEEVQKFETLFNRERKNRNIEIPTALLMIDLDGFKEINDTCGHACGDRCLRLLAEQVRGALRESDSFARMGGDEFGIFLTEDDEQGALQVAEKIRSLIEGVVTETIRREFSNYKGKLSASIGVVAMDGKGLIDGEHMDIEKIIKYGDYAAYVVKAAGKKGELTLNGAREVDTDGQYERDFLAGKTLPR